jgi:hypothetical protein
VKASSVDAERLASLLDGRVDEQARATLLTQIAASDDALEDLVVASGILAEVESHREAGRAGRPERPRRWRRNGWFAIAAVLVAVLALPWVIGKRDPSPNARRGIEEMLSTDRPALPPGWTEHLWAPSRGATTTLPHDARAVRLGAYLVDFEAARRSADPRARDIAASIAALLDDIPGGVVLAAPYRAATTGDVSPAVAARPAVVEAAGVVPVAVGVWTERARLAAARHDSAFFAALPFTDVERWMEQTNATPSARAALAHVRESARVTGPRDWGPLQSDLETILSELGAPHG